MVRARSRRSITLRPIEVTRSLEGELYRIVSQIPRYWREQSQAQLIPAYADAVAIATQDEEASPLAGVIEGIAAGATRLVVSLRPGVEAFVTRIERWHRGRWVSGVRQATGVDVSTIIGGLDAESEIAAFQEWASGLIRNISEDQRRQIEAATFRHLADLKRPDDLAREVNRIAGTGRKRARFIASDQANKLSGKMDELRHREAGIEEYRWETARDDRVRPTHRANQGKVFRWDQPPTTTGHPRTEPRCRCSAQPYIPLLEEIEADE